jgi:hypothetical protein
MEVLGKKEAHSMYQLPTCTVVAVANESYEASCVL